MYSRAYNPCVQPISAGDFAIAVANLLIKANVIWKSEFLWGGPQVFTWRQVGDLIQDVIGKRSIFHFHSIIRLEALVVNVLCSQE